MSRTVTIEGYEYEVVKSDTPDELEAKGYPTVAIIMRHNGDVEQLVCRKPKGKKLWMFIRSQYKGIDYYRQVNSRGW